MPGVEGLEVLDLDPQAAADAFRERSLSPYRGTLPPGELAAFEEHFAGACTVEIAAFDAFTGLRTDRSLASRYDRIVFDTAPTGHTLLLLDYTGAFHRQVLRDAPEMVASRITTPLMLLQDPAFSRVVLVTLAEGAAAPSSTFRTSTG